MRYTHPKLLEHLASSFVLGTLQGGARRRFERLQRDRLDVRMLVAQWEMRLGQLARSIPLQSPPPRLWAAISARTQPTAKTAALHRPFWAGWLKPAGIGLGGLAGGVLLASVVFFTAPTLFITADQVAMRSGERLPPSYIGVLSDAQGNGKLLVSSLRHGKTVVLKVIGPMAVPGNGHLVLWAIAADGTVFSLGTVPTSGKAVSQLPDTSEKLLSKVGKLMVTLETTPTPASPSATVVLSGNCAKLW